MISVFFLSHLSVNEEFKNVKNVEKSIGLTAEYTIKFCEKIIKDLFFRKKRFKKRRKIRRRNIL